MTHKHEWYAFEGDFIKEPNVICREGCKMPFSEMFNRLNATEELSAEDAWEINNATVAIAEEVGITAILPKRAPLRAYAEALDE